MKGRGPKFGPCFPNRDDFFSTTSAERKERVWNSDPCFLSSDNTFFHYFSGVKIQGSEFLGDVLTDESADEVSVLGRGITRLRRVIRMDKLSSNINSASGNSSLSKNSANEEIENKNKRPQWLLDEGGPLNRAWLSHPSPLLQNVKALWILKDYNLHR